MFIIIIIRETLNEFNFVIAILDVGCGGAVVEGGRIQRSPETRSSTGARHSHLRTPFGRQRLADEVQSNSKELIVL